MTSTVVTLIVRLMLLDPELFVTVSVTVLDPAVANVWLGFWEVLVPPSPKFHCHAVGPPVDVSVNATDCPGAGKAGLYVKDAVSAPPTVTVRVVLLEPEPLVAVRVTVLDPAVVNAWLGFRDVLVPPSPKFHCHEVGLPVDVSVNATDCPNVGEAGLKVKDATGAFPTVTVRFTLLDPELFVAVRITAYAPEAAKE